MSFFISRRLSRFTLKIQLLLTSSRKRVYADSPFELTLCRHHIRLSSLILFLPRIR